MTTTFVADNGLTLSPSSGAATVYTGTGLTPGALPGHVYCMGVNWSAPATPALTLVVTGAKSIWVPASAALNSTTTWMQSFMGIPSATGADTLTFSFFNASHVATAPTGLGAPFVDEFVTSLSSPNWGVDLLGTARFNTGASPILTSGTDVVPLGDFFYAEFISGATSFTGNSNAQTWITYDRADFMLYGDAPANENPVPATGFTYSGSHTGAMVSMVLNPKSPVAGPLWVPPGVDLGTF